MNTIIRVIGSLACAVVMGAMAAGEPQVKVVLKFVKRGAVQALSPLAFEQRSCITCQLLADPAFDRDNQRETLVALSVPARRTLDLQFRTAGTSVKRVLLESGDLKFDVKGDMITVHMPPVARDAVTAGEFATHIVEPGMVLRFEHADPARRAGFYAQGDFPALQRRAADNLEFAQREVIRRTGLGAYVAHEKLGAIQVMGFDTNFPHGHTDAPPHIHMHLRWPLNAGTQIGHYYIDEQGLLARNEVGIKAIGGRGQNFGRGEIFTTRDVQGRPTYTHEITKQGWLRLGRADMDPCLIRPVGKGFDSGAIVECPQQEMVSVHVRDDLGAGILRVTAGNVEEIFRYDIDTGELLSDPSPPPATESNYSPQS
ncbi:hypothetical protein [Duganella levis]|uniref:Uncharacterized protein n=1 Tax=Duganella levis TaxID=2692169 RepID=A0ABW9VT90_9BURK|nr:hypothetical protein [Duganella levis]MYN24837.1 hypothetical protein [Duganella levis]